jgi:hypothetical protein
MIGRRDFITLLGATAAEPNTMRFEDLLTRYGHAALDAAARQPAAAGRGISSWLRLLGLDP